MDVNLRDKIVELFHPGQDTDAYEFARMLYWNSDPTYEDHCYVYEKLDASKEAGTSTEFHKTKKEHLRRYKIKQYEYGHETDQQDS